MEEEINRLRFENKIWILFAFLCLLNIRGDNDDINYIKTNNNKYKNESNNIFKFTLICTLFISLEEMLDFIIKQIPNKKNYIVLKYMVLSY